jgi:hypothetical protein
MGLSRQSSLGHSVGLRMGLKGRLSCGQMSRASPELSFGLSRWQKTGLNSRVRPRLSRELLMQFPTKAAVDRPG